MADTTSRTGTPDRASIARETNGHIRALARSFQDEREVGFLCECGCFDAVLATLAEYDEHGGVWIDGHSTPNEPGRSAPAGSPAGPSLHSVENA